MQKNREDSLPDRIGPYIPVRFIRSGGFSSIVAARHYKTSTRVALRILSPKHKFNVRLRHNFFLSAKILRQLDHENWLKVMESGRGSGVVYTVMELIDGPPLSAIIAAHDEGLTGNALSVMLGAARGLSYLHSKGWLHLDFKPENILIRAPWQPVLIDLDLARRMPRKREQGKRVRKTTGTAAYMAPELLQDHRISEKADIYAFGVTCFEILTFRKPWGNTRQELSKAFASAESHQQPNVRRWNPDVSPAIAEIVHRCIAFNPNDRYPTIHLVLRDLERNGDRTVVHGDPTDPLFDTVMIRPEEPDKPSAEKDQDNRTPAIMPRTYWVKKQPDDR